MLIGTFFQWYATTLFEAEDPKNLFLETLATALREAEFKDKVISGVQERMRMSRGMVHEGDGKKALRKRLDIGGGFFRASDFKLKGLFY